MLGPFLSNHLMKRRFQFLLMRQKGLSCIRSALVNNQLFRRYLHSLHNGHLRRTV